MPCYKRACCPGSCPEKLHDGATHQAEVLISLLDGDDVHEASGVGGISADLAVNSDQALLQDGLHLLARQRVLQTVAQHQHQGQALPLLVRAGGGLGGLQNDREGAMLTGELNAQSTSPAEEQPRWEATPDASHRLHAGSDHT